MTKQEIFDKAVIGVLSQGGYAVVKNDYYGNKRCMLRTRTGKKCAFGQLIPNEVYDRGMEDYSFLKSHKEQFFSMFPEVEHLSKYSNLLEDLQEWHDDSAYLAPSSKNRNSLEKYMFTNYRLDSLFNICKKHKISLKNVNTYVVSRGYNPIEKHK